MQKIPFQNYRVRLFRIKVHKLSATELEVLDRIAEYFQATSNQIFGSSQEIELEYAVLQTDEYNERAKETLTQLKKIEQYFENPEFMDKVNNATYLILAQPIFNERGEQLSWKIDEQWQCR